MDYMDHSEQAPCWACTTPDGSQGYRRWRTWCPICGGAGVVNAAWHQAERERIRAHMQALMNAAGFTLIRECVIDLSGATVGTTGVIDLRDRAIRDTLGAGGGGQ